MTRKNDYLFSLIAVLIFCVFSFSTVAQVNLVPNPSFEDTVFCPWGTTQLEACSLWQNFGNTPDYFNACSQIVNVPHATFGYQNAHTGVGMAGLATYKDPNDYPNYREIIGIELTHPLQLNEKYFFSFYLNFANTINVAIASNNIGLRFFTLPYDSCCPPTLDNFAHLHADSIITDSIGWTKLSGSFFADSTYGFISIGNFFNDLQTDTMILSAFPDYAYYYIDDVCVTTDSNYNQVWSSTPIIIQQREIVDLKITSYSLELNSKYDPILSVIVYNNIGHKLFQANKINSYEFNISLERFNNSIYFIRILTRNSNIIKKVSIMY